MDITHEVTVYRLRQLLSGLKDADVLVPNELRNIAVLRDGNYIGHINLLKDQARLEIGEDDRRDYLVLECMSNLWWRPNAGGYTSDLLGAGLYTREEAERYARDPSRKEKAVPLISVVRDLEDAARNLERLRSALP